MSRTPPHTPPPAGALRQSAQDATHLQLLVIFYYVFAGLNALGACAGLLYVGMGAVMSSMPPDPSPASPNEPDPAVIGWIMSGFGGCILCFSLALAILYFLDARWVSQRRHMLLTQILAALSCLSVPLGTALGVYTFIVMARPGVRAMYDGAGRLDASDPH